VLNIFSNEQLWFRRRLPAYATKFIEMVLMMTADHGPAVAGAHNTIVTARAGCDMIPSLVSGLMTIGPRFGGAVDGAAKMFSSAYDQGLTYAFSLPLFVLCFSSFLLLFAYFFNLIIPVLRNG
jgi:citrate synthase